MAEQMEAVRRALMNRYLADELALIAPPTGVPPVAGNRIPLSGCQVAATLLGGSKNLRSNSAPPAPMKSLQT